MMRASWRCSHDAVFMKTLHIFMKIVQIHEAKLHPMRQGYVQIAPHKPQKSRSKCTSASYHEATFPITPGASLRSATLLT
jgi:hypothetical protein